MKVQELIDLLQTYPADMKVCFISPMPDPKLVKIASVDLVTEEKTDFEKIVALWCKYERRIIPN